MVYVRGQAPVQPVQSGASPVPGQSDPDPRLPVQAQVVQAQVQLVYAPLSFLASACPGPNRVQTFTRGHFDLAIMPPARYLGRSLGRNGA
jgi:hypothetical protein